MRRALSGELPESVSTIHSLLGYAPVSEEYETVSEDGQLITKTKKVFRPTFTEDFKLPYDCYIVDEGGMVPIVPLWNELIAAMKPTARIVIVGDIHQLPPVQGKGILGYAIAGMAHV